MTPYFALGRSVVAAIALSFTLAACGGGGSDSDPSVAPPQGGGGETTEPETPAAPQLRCAP